MAVQGQGSDHGRGMGTPLGGNETSTGLRRCEFFGHDPATTGHATVSLKLLCLSDKLNDLSVLAWP